MPEGTEIKASMVSDLIGLGETATVLINAIQAGIGKWYEPFHLKRMGQAQREEFDSWEIALQKKGLSVDNVELNLAARAEVRFLADKIRNQYNRESIALEAVEEIKLLHNDGKIASDIKDLNHDWLEYFWDLSGKIGNEELQKFWGLILARTVAGETPVTPRTLQILSNLTPDEAAALQTFANGIIEIDYNGYVKYSFMDKLLTKDMNYYDVKIREKILEIFSIEKLDLFISIGIFSENGIHHRISVFSSDSKASFKMGGKSFFISGISNSRLDGEFFSLGLGYKVSPLGSDIFRFLLKNSQPDESYVAILSDAYAEEGLSLTKRN